jgi:hypothetical protein
MGQVETIGSVALRKVTFDSITITTEGFKKIPLTIESIGFKGIVVSFRLDTVPIIG